MTHQDSDQGRHAPERPERAGIASRECVNGDPNAISRTRIGAYRPTPVAILILTLAAAAGTLAGFVVAVLAAVDGDIEPLNAFGFGVILPVTGVLLILSLGPSRTREGALMRIGCALQLILIISLPRFALHLLLGLPVVFLAVELFETRLPAWLREPLARFVVR